eukprot:7954651-Lingulodinium_polyedra.AAC.1
MSGVMSWKYDPTTAGSPSWLRPVTWLAATAAPCSTAVPPDQPPLPVGRAAVQAPCQPRDRMRCALSSAACSGRCVSCTMKTCGGFSSSQT